MLRTCTHRKKALDQLAITYHCGRKGKGEPVMDKKSADIYAGDAALACNDFLIYLFMNWGDGAE